MQLEMMQVTKIEIDPKSTRAKRNFSPSICLDFEEF